MVVGTAPSVSGVVKSSAFSRVAGSAPAVEGSPLSIVRSVPASLMVVRMGDSTGGAGGGVSTVLIARVGPRFAAGKMCAFGGKYGGYIGGVG